MPKGLKIWLWIVLFMDIITFIYYGRLFLLGLSAAAALHDTGAAADNRCEHSAVS